MKKAKKGADEEGGQYLRDKKDDTQRSGVEHGKPHSSDEEGGPCVDAKAEHPAGLCLVYFFLLQKPGNHFCTYGIAAQHAHDDGASAGGREL